jgi:hypothetical protein
MIVQVGNQSSVAGSFHPSQAGKSEWSIILHPDRKRNLSAANRAPFIKAISAE